MAMTAPGDRFLKREKLRTVQSLSSFSNIGCDIDGSFCADIEIFWPLKLKHLTNDDFSDK